MASLHSFTACVLAALPLGGCGPTIHPTFDSPEPAARNSAIVLATAANDENSVPDLVHMLESDDPATRLLAITSLQRLTGETLGYEYGASPFERAEAVNRWHQWIVANQKKGAAS